MHRLGSPDVSPDGRSAVFTVSDTDWGKNKRSGVLRPGSSTLMTWDFPFGADVDAAAVGDYVREALAKRDAFLADAGGISAAAKERARNR